MPLYFFDSHLYGDLFVCVLHIHYVCVSHLCAQLTLQKKLWFSKRPAVFTNALHIPIRLPLSVAPNPELFNSYRPLKMSWQPKRWHRIWQFNRLSRDTNKSVSHWNRSKYGSNYCRVFSPIACVHGIETANEIRKKTLRLNAIAVRWMLIVRWMHLTEGYISLYLDIVRTNICIHWKFNMSGLVCGCIIEPQLHS